MEVVADLSQLSSLEYDKIVGVLKRDRELRSLEETRIRQLTQELTYLRKKGALRAGLDASRTCARCISELGRIINRGAFCPLCRKKVCKACRQYGDGDSQWLCIFCHKQMQLKAISGEWMHEFNRCSSRRRFRPPPGDQLRRALHESQRKGLIQSEPRQQQQDSASVETSEQDLATKTLRTSCQDDKATVDGEPSEPGICCPEDFSMSVPSSSRELPLQQSMEKSPLKNADLGDSLSSSSATTSPKPIQRLSPWNGIEAEPSIPVRLPRAAPLGFIMPPDSPDAWTHRDRQSSDDGHSTMSVRSRSTSSEVMDDVDTVAPKPAPRKRLSPLRKQQAVVETTDNRHSSVDTTDSGVCSPIFKGDVADNVTAPSSPRPLTRASVDHSSDSSDHNHQLKLAQHLGSDSSGSGSDKDDDEKPEGVVFRKVTLRKRKPMTGSKAQDEEEQAKVSTDESGTSLRSSPHGRLRVRGRTSSGGSDDGKQKKGSVPQISVSECNEPSQIGRLSAASSEKDSVGLQDDDLDQVFAYHSRSQISLSSFGTRSESMTSVYSAAGGGRYGTVTVTGEVLFSLNYNYKGGAMEVHIKECRNLAPVDTKRNRSDPYVKVYLLPDRTKSGKRKTKVKKHTLSPVFDELLKFQVTISELETRTLWLSVWHSDMFGRNDFLGEVMLPLGYDTFESPGLKWYPLQERLETLDSPVSYKGDLILALKYVPPDVTSRKHPKRPGDQAKGALHVLVKEARNLMATRSNGTSDPFCKSYLLPDKSKSGKQKTPVLKKTCSPKWNHTFVYDDVTLTDLRERCLELTIWDYDKITSNDFLGGVRLSLGAGKYQGRDVEWMDSIGEEVSLWYTMLDRPNMWVDGSLLLRPSMQSRRT